MGYKTVILDFDGVLVESNAIKTEAFKALFAHYPEHLDAILDYHHRHAVIRFQKFKHIYEHILKRPYTVEEEEKLSAAFSSFCLEAVVQCPEVKGASQFLKDFVACVPLYLVSINPADDLNQILEARMLSGFFKKVYTTEGSKAEAIKDILTTEHLKAHEAVFIGDSQGDFTSAKEAGVDFIGRLTQDSGVFAGMPAFEDMQQIASYLKDKVEVVHA